MSSLPHDSSDAYHRVLRSAIAWVLGYTLLAALLPGMVALVAVVEMRDYLAAALAMIVPIGGFYLNAIGVRSILRRRAYPQKYWEEAGGCLATMNRVTLVAATIAATLTLLIFRWENAVIVAVFAYAVILLLLLVGPLFLHNTLHDVSLAPYFESKVGGTYHHCGGVHIARHMEELDDLARQHGVTPLSEFGWNDDLKGELNVWHDALKGVKTVNVLLAHFEADELAKGENSAVENELKILSQALSQACDRKIRFCLLLFCGEATNEMKEAQRKGSML